MLIVPFYRKINWRSPPLITLALVLINGLIFLGFQANDDWKTHKAIAFYADSKLPAAEVPKYVEYLKNQHRTDEAGKIQMYFDKGKDYASDLLFAIQYDAGFIQKLYAKEIIRPDAKSFDEWKQQRQELDSLLNQVVWYKYGFRPGDPNITSVFTQMFLHGGLGHLLGNMVFLVLLGFTVEIILGKAVFLIAYLLTGLGACGMEIIFHSNSIVPSVGASGAIAGVMGMFLVLFGFRKIRFFYTVIFYFDFIKAPAIIMFPLWLGMQMYEMFLGGPSHVAYLAHIGGLLSGGAIAFMIRNLTDRVNIEYMDADDKEEADISNHDEAMQCMSNMQFARAATIFRQLYDKQPENQTYLKGLYNAAKHNPESDNYHFATRKIFLQAVTSRPDVQQLADVFNEYIKLCGSKSKFTSEILFSLAMKFAKHDCLQEAEKIAHILLKSKFAGDVRLANVLLNLYLAYKQRLNEDKMKIYARELLARFPGSSEVAQLNT